MKAISARFRSDGTHRPPRRFTFTQEVTMSEDLKTKTDPNADPADELKKQDAEEPTTGAVPDGPTRSDQVGEKPLITPGKSSGL
jgi:hypothetical protein